MCKYRDHHFDKGEFSVDVVCIHGARFHRIVSEIDYYIKIFRRPGFSFGRILNYKFLIRFIKVLCIKCFFTEVKNSFENCNPAKTEIYNIMFNLTRLNNDIKFLPINIYLTNRYFVRNSHFLKRSKLFG